jgi:peptidoglycan hydrolase-like amidase
LKQLCKRDPTAVGKSINDVRTNYNVHNFRDDQKLDAAYDAKQLRKRQQRKLKLEAEQRIEKEREKSAFHAGVLSTAAGTTAFSAGALANAAGLIAVKREKFEDLQEKSIADRQTAERRLKAETEERKRVTRLLDEKTRLLNEKDAALQLMWKKHTAVNSLCVAADRTVRERESEITSMRANQSSAADAMNKTASLEAALAREEAARVYAFRMLQETVTALERARADHLLAARHFVEQEEDFAILRSTIMVLSFSLCCLVAFCIDLKFVHS